jgi:hypothetical protein
MKIHINNNNTYKNKDECSRANKNSSGLAEQALCKALANVSRRVGMLKNLSTVR